MRQRGVVLARAAGRGRGHFRRYGDRRCSVADTIRNHGVNCEAWIEESTIETEKIDLGWPPTRFLKQTSTLEEALKELRVLGSELAAAGYTPQIPITSIPEE